jgi:cytochrome c-type biogenesis protein
MDLDVGYVAAAVAGLLSFASPCVLPLIPPYLCFLGGVTLEQISGAAPKNETGRRVILAALAFVLGFTTVFVALGASATAVSQALAASSGWLSKIAGVVIILFGLHFLGLLRIGLLNRELRAYPQRPVGLLGAYTVGLAFAFGWTPCIGPVLATILTIAAARESALEGAALLGVYALGIGVPFLLAALFVRPFLAALRRGARHLHRVEQAMGVLLVVTGSLMLAGSFADIGFWLQQAFPALGRLG